MKFNFSNIQHPTIADSPTSPTVSGFLPSGEKVEVTRYLSGWQVYLKITVNGFIQHDCKVEPDEIEQVNILRERAMTAFDNRRDLERAAVRRNTKAYLFPDFSA